MRPFPCTTMTLRTQGRVLSTYGPTRRFQLLPDAWSRMFNPSDDKMDLFDSSTEKISESTMMRSPSDGAYEACPRQRGGKSGKKCVTTACRRKRSSKLKMSPGFLDSSSSPIALDRVQIQNGTFKKSKRRRLLLLSFESDSDLEPLKKCEVGKSGLKNSKKSMSPFAKNRKTKKRRKPGPAAKDSKEKRKITLNANMQIQGYELLADKTPDRDGDQDKLGKLSATSKWKSPTMKENIQGKRRKKNNGQHTSDIAHPKVYRDNLLPASLDADPLCHKSQDNMMDASSKDCPELLGSQGEEDMILNAMQHSRYVTVKRRKVRVSKERLSVLVPMYPLEYEIKSWKKLISSTPNGAACSVHQENLHLLSPLPFNSSMLTNNCEKRQIAGPLSHFVGVAQNSLSCRTGEEDTFLPKSNDTMDYSVVFSVSSPGVTSPNVCRTEHSQCASKSVAKASFSSRYLANHIGLKTKSSEADDVLAVYEHHFQPLSANKMLSNTHLAKYKNDQYLVKSSSFCKVDRNMKESPHFQSDPGFENVPDAKQLCTSCSVILEDVFHSKDLSSSLKRFGVPFKGNRSCISQNTNLQRTREDQTEENPHLSQIELSTECGVDPAVGVYKLCRCGNNISEDGLLHWCPCMGKSAKMKEAYFWLNRPQVSLQRLPCAVLKELQMYGVVTCKSPFWLGRQSELHSSEFPEEPLRKKANVSGCRDQKVQEMFTYRSGQVGNGLDLDCRVSLMRSEITPQALGTCHLSGMAQEVGDLVDEELHCNLSDSNHETPNRRSKCSFMQDGTPQRVESCHQQSQLAMPKFTPRSWMIQKLLSFYHETTYHESPPLTPVQSKSSASRVFARLLPSSVGRVEFGSSKCQQWSRFTSSLTACRQKTVIYTPPKGHKPIGEALSPCVGSSPNVYHALQTSGHVPSSRWSMAFNTSLPVERLDFGNLTVAKTRLDVSLSDTMNPKPPLALQELSTAERLFSECGQNSPIPFELVITDEVLKTCVKIGEGVYGEVYSSTNHNGETSALKIVPIEGLCTVNGEPQKTFEEILPEIIIAKELFLLSNGKLNSTEGFIKVKRIVCVQGCYPNSLLFLWDLFTAENSSYNNRPDFFTDSQLYIIFEFENGGCDLERFKLRSLEQGVSVLKQVTAALAVAEETLKFEHRDLHWGNILIHETDEEETVYVLGGETHTIATHGIKTRLIDYTLSRLEKDGFTVFTNLGTDDTLFTGRGDYQFDIYRKMKAENGNEWSSFHPHSNVLWLHYLAHKLAKVGNQGSNQNRTLRSQFTAFLRKCLSFSSAADLLGTSLFRD